MQQQRVQNDHTTPTKGPTQPKLHLPRLPPMPTKWQANHLFDNTGKKLGIDNLLQGTMAATWWTGLDNKLGRLSNGIPNTSIEGSQTIDFIYKKDILERACMMYANMVCNE